MRAATAQLDSRLKVVLYDLRLKWNWDLMILISPRQKSTASDGAYGNANASLTLACNLVSKTSRPKQLLICLMFACANFLTSNLAHTLRHEQAHEAASDTEDLAILDDDAEVARGIPRRRDAEEAHGPDVVSPCLPLGAKWEKCLHTAHTPPRRECLATYAPNAKVEGMSYRAHRRRRGLRDVAYTSLPTLAREAFSQAHFAD